MMKLFTTLITIDKFLTLQNGSLVQIFNKSYSPELYKVKIIRKIEKKITIKLSDEYKEEILKATTPSQALAILDAAGIKYTHSYE